MDKYRLKADPSRIFSVTQNMEPATQVIEPSDFVLVEDSTGAVFVNTPSGKLAVRQTPTTFEQSTTWPTQADFQAELEPVPAAEPPVTPPVEVPPASPPVDTPPAAPPVDTPPAGEAPIAQLVVARVVLYRKKSDPDCVVPVLENNSDQLITVAPGQKLLVDGNGWCEVFNAPGIAAAWEPLPPS